MRFSRAIQDSRPEPFALTFAALAAGVALWLLAMRRPAALAPWKPLVAAGIVALALVSPPLLIAIVPGVLWMLAPEAGKPGRLPESLALFLGAFGLLMVYPVPGAQLAVAASLLLAGAFAAMVPPAPPLPLRAWFAVPAMLGRPSTLSILSAALMLVAGAQAGRVIRSYTTAPAARQHLAHANLVRFSPEEYETYSHVLAAVTAHCSTLATVPGMNSFQIWSGLPHPNGFIYSAAMPLFDEATQQRLLRAFSAAPSPCVVYNSSLETWGEMYRPPLPAQPFVDFVKHGLVPVFAINHYEIRVPPADAARWR
jgi:hypothetical protein